MINLFLNHLLFEIVVKVLVTFLDRFIDASIATPGEVFFPIKPESSGWYLLHCLIPLPYFLLRFSCGATQFNADTRNSFSCQVQLETKPRCKATKCSLRYGRYLKVLDENADKSTSALVKLLQRTKGLLRTQQRSIESSLRTY